MNTSDYHQFVKDTSQFDEESDDQKFNIAIYGVAGEIGSVVAAIKKQLLQEGGVAQWNSANDEIIEELGDTIWYCFTLARIHNKGSFKNILRFDIEELIKEIDSDTPRAGVIARVLSPQKREKFLKEAPLFCRSDESAFDEYQRIAFLTARTEKKNTVGSVLIGTLAAWSRIAQGEASGYRAKAKPKRNGSRPRKSTR